MTVYVLGAGASHHAGYPLASSMAEKLFGWMTRSVRDPDSYAARYPATARYLRESFPSSENVEDLVTAIRELIDEFENGTREQRIKRAVVADEYGVFKNAVRDWFAEIQSGLALESSAYRDFASNIVAEHDCIITFNYDVSLERELRHAGKFEVGDGYGFLKEGLPMGSKTRVLKLHGSTSWLALLFGGMTSGYSSFQPGNTLSMPVIGSNELSFLGYANAIDPRFRSGGAALPVMIFPARSKDFYYAASTGVEYAGFWDDLWEQARGALRAATRVVVCGYSLLAVDERARSMLLTAPKRDVEIVVASGGDTKRIVQEYREAGYGKAVAADDELFQDWVAATLNSLAAIR